MRRKPGAKSLVIEVNTSKAILIVYISDVHKYNTHHKTVRNICMSFILRFSETFADGLVFIDTDQANRRIREPLGS